MTLVAMAVRVSAALLVSAGLAGCQPDTTPGTGAAPSALSTARASAVAVAPETPSCTAAGGQQLCSLRVWYTNITDAEIVIDATRTAFRDSDGTIHSGTVGDSARSLTIAAHARELVQWGVQLPPDVQLVAVVWTGPDGTATGELALTPSPDAAASVSDAPTATPTPSATPKPTPTPKPTATAKPTPTPKATPKPSVTAPTGSIG